LITLRMPSWLKAKRSNPAASSVAGFARVRSLSASKPSRAFAGLTAIALTAGVAGVGTVIGTAAPASAAPAVQGGPFDCTVPGFFAQAESSNKVQLYKGGYTSDGKSAWDTVGSSVSSPLYNAGAFNPVDGYIYGTIYGTNGGQFVRVDKDGGVTTIGASNPALGTSYSSLWDSGEFDADGNYYVASGNAGGNIAKTIYKISGLDKVTTATSGTRPAKTNIPLNSVNGVPVYADLTFKDNFLWAPNYGKNSTIYRIDINMCLTRAQVG